MPSASNQNRKGVGGNATHKDPNCQCPGCKARRRKAEALALAAREGGAALDAPEVKEVIHADDGTLVTSLPAYMQEKGDVTRSLVGQWLVLRSQDPSIPVTEASKKIGVHVRTLYRHINKAVKAGWLKFDDPLDRIEHEIVPKTLDNISRFLDEGDRTVTIEAAKGTIFHAYKASKEAVHTSQPILALKIELAPNAEATTVSVGGNVFGKPRDMFPIIEAEAVPEEGLDVRPLRGDQADS